ncbi:MAG: hypothetical protein K2P48_07185 [Lachnospiraceae bacterium]|nr:hypothetical protein [Lachnospiraceae bacterium]
MNMMERNDHSKERRWRDDIRGGKQEGHEAQTGDDLLVEDLDMMEREENGEDKAGLHGLLQRPYMTTVLLGVIVLLLLCIIVLLFLIPGKKKLSDVNGDLQQNITEYAQEQKRNDVVRNTSGEAVVVKLPEEQDENKDAGTVSGQETQSGQSHVEEKMPASDEFVSADGDKTAVVIDIEDENDVAYTKEFILNEALPYFADNNQDAIWDLAHLKRYVKLSAGLEGTNQYYYMGGVNSNGRPEGKGLAIYEKNSYYYGDWSDGIRSGEGVWFKFYIGQKDEDNAMGKYMAHSYSGSWANDLPNGQGAEHYDVDTSKLQVRERILQNVVGNFNNGLYDGELYANTVDYTGNVEEWSGITEKGVFQLWRDMSAIGECSVWQKVDDSSLYMDIDKSENKNQGLKELLKPETK